MPEPLRNIITFLSQFAPLSLAEDWDNVGLLLGDDAAALSRIMTCLTLTEDVAEEAVARQADLVVSHHPILFRPVQRITTHTPEGRTLRTLIRGNIAVYSPHTAFDSARLGINQQLAEALGLQEITPLKPLIIDDGAGDLGAGRLGSLPAPMPLIQLIDQVRALLPATCLQYAGDPQQTVRRVGVACGAAASLMPDAQKQGCDVFLTGEARFHDALAARQTGIGLILAGHYATERPGVERLAQILQNEFPKLECWASQTEQDPLQWSMATPCDPST